MHGGGGELLEPFGEVFLVLAARLLERGQLLRIKNGLLVAAPGVLEAAAPGQAVAGLPLEEAQAPQNGGVGRNAGDQRFAALDHPHQVRPGLLFLAFFSNTVQRAIEFR